MEPTTKDKLLATVSYFSFGIIGFVLLLIKQAEGRFLKYHVYQSILIGLLCMFFNYGLNLFLGLGMDLFSLIPVVQGFAVVAFSVFMKLINVAELVLLIYCVFGTWKSEYTQVKWISEQINRMI